MCEYYPYVFAGDNVDYFCIWYTTKDNTGFIVESNKIKTFNFIEDLCLYAKNNRLNIEREITRTNLDFFKKWLESDVKIIDCVVFLDFWNIIMDVAWSFGEDFYEDTKNEVANDIYNKLFYGNNLPAIKAEGDDFIPNWNAEEINELSNVIADGVRRLEKWLVNT
jgi:Zn-finger protein